MLHSANLELGEDFRSDGGYNVFGNTAFQRDMIRSITFVDSLNGFKKDSSTWDASADGSGSVKAMALPSSGDGYNLYIGAEGGVALPEDCTALFMNYTSLMEVNFNGCVDFSRVTSMRNMFYNCISLGELSFSDPIDTSNVQNMTGMFRDCISLGWLDLSGLDTSNVTSMSMMFMNCVSIGELNLSSFDTSNVTDMSFMFCNCTLSELNIESFNTARVESMSHMFASIAVRSDYLEFDMVSTGSGWCLDLGGELNLWNFDYSSVTDVSNMFHGQGRIEDIYLGAFKAGEKLKNMSGMFRNCEALYSINFDPRATDTSSVTDMSSMFENCRSLQSFPSDINVILEALNTSSVTNFKNMFKDCTSLKELRLVFDTSSATNMHGMFNGCINLESLQLGFDSSNVTDFAYMFANCRRLKEIKAGALDTSSAVDVSHMFEACDVLTQLDLSSYDLTNVQDMKYMFAGCGVLKHIEATPLFASAYPYQAAHLCEGMFEDCPVQICIYVCKEVQGNEAAAMLYTGEEWMQLAFGRSQMDQGPKGKLGSRGENVLWCQSALEAKGYSVGGVDGQFGQKTENALKAFQQDSGLEVTGKADYASQKRLYS